LTPVVATLTDDDFWSALPDRQRKAVELIRRNVDLEVNLIDDLLDVTRIARNRLDLRREPLNVHDALNEVVAMCAEPARTRTIRVQTNLAAKGPWVVGDPTRLRQVFWNLLSNAIKFTEVGGTVTIASADNDRGQLVVTTTDSGIGMSAQLLRELAQNEEGPKPLPSASGLGLGLMICQGIVRAHGGTLRATSKGHGKGSTFEVTLESAGSTSLESRHRRHSTLGKEERSVRILLVEDHQDTSEALSMLLRNHGFNVQVAESVDVAVRLATAGCDVIISDIRLPDGSGIDLMRRLRAMFPIRGIALSGFGSQEDVRRSLQAGYDVHLTKPVDLSTLIEVIEEVSAKSH
jgi:CheY-like chemotaxis protein